MDPFVGTGTSIVAALKHGKRGIGIDVSEQYAEVARQRVEKYLATGLEC